MRDENPALAVFHAGQKLHKHHGWVGSPVAIVAAVQTAIGAINSDFDMCISPRTEDKCLLPALIDRAIADQPNVSMNQVAISIQNLFEVRRAGLFFALPHEANVSP